MTGMATTRHERFAGDYFLTGDDGTVYYPIVGPSHTGQVVPKVSLPYPEGVEPPGRYDSAPYWVCSPEGPVETVTFTTPGQHALAGWKLRDPETESVAFPLTLPADAMDDGYDSGLESDDDPRLPFYERDYTSGPDVIVEASTEGLSPMPGGGPDLHPDVNWVPYQPARFAYSENYWHLLPGSTADLHPRLLAELLRIYGNAERGGPWVTFQRDGLEAPLTLTANVGYNPPIRGRKPRTQQVSLIDVSTTVRRSSRIRAATKAEGVALLNTTVQAWVDYAASKVNARPCAACHGNGSRIVPLPEPKPV